MTTATRIMERFQGQPFAPDAPGISIGEACVTDCRSVAHDTRTGIVRYTFPDGSQIQSYDGRRWEEVTP